MERTDSHTPGLVARITRRLVPAALSVFASASFACVEMDLTDETLSEDEIESQTQGISSSVPLFVDESCSAAEQDLLEDAMGVASFWLNTWPEPLENCMADVFLSPDYDEHVTAPEDSVETIMQRMRENMPTTFKCDEVNYNASAGYSPGQELVRFNKKWLAKVSWLEVAGVILHEVSHNKGYDHPAGVEYNYTVPDQLATCLGEIYGQPNLYPNNTDVKRSDLAGETELSQVGAGGGFPHELACTNGSHFDAVYLGIGQQWGYTVVKRLIAFCRDKDGNYTSQGTAGFGSLDSYQYRSCPNGYRATGIYGRSGLLIDSLGLLCTPLSDLEAGIANYDMVESGEAGGAGGVDFRRKCPAGMAISHILGRSAEAIDQLRIVCQDVNETRGTFAKSGVYGSTDGYARFRRCSGYGALVGLYGQRNNQINRLGGRCLETHEVSASLFSKYPEVTPDTNHITAANGYDWGGLDSALQLDCPASEMMVGMRMRHTSEVITSVGAICADPQAWQFSVIPSLHYTSMSGGSAGTLESYTCDKGKFAVGLDSWAGDDASVGHDVIKGVRVVCRTLASSKKLIKVQ